MTGIQTLDSLCSIKEVDSQQHVHSPHGLTTLHIFIHKEKRETHRKFIYEPLQALNFQKKPMAFIKFQPKDTPNIKGRSNSAKEMHHKRRQ